MQERIAAQKSMCALAGQSTRAHNRDDDISSKYQRLLLSPCGAGETSPCPPTTDNSEARAENDNRCRFQSFGTCFSLAPCPAISGMDASGAQAPPFPCGPVTRTMVSLLRGHTTGLGTATATAASSVCTARNTCSDYISHAETAERPPSADIVNIPAGDASPSSFPTKALEDQTANMPPQSWASKSRDLYDCGASHGLLGPSRSLRSASAGGELPHLPPLPSAPRVSDPCQLPYGENVRHQPAGAEAAQHLRTVASQDDRTNSTTHTSGASPRRERQGLLGGSEVAAANFAASTAAAAAADAATSDIQLRQESSVLTAAAAGSRQGDNGGGTQHAPMYDIGLRHPSTAERQQQPDLDGAAALPRSSSASGWPQQAPAVAVAAAAPTTTAPYATHRPDYAPLSYCAESSNRGGVTAAAAENQVLPPPMKTVSGAAHGAPAAPLYGTAAPPSLLALPQRPSPSLPPPVQVQVASRCRRGADRSAARGRVTRGSLGLFHPQQYLAGGDCIECGSEMMSRGRFEKLAGTATAKWHVSIKVLPSGITLGRWLQQHGLPILQGRPRKRRATSEVEEEEEVEEEDDNAEDADGTGEAAAVGGPRPGDSPPLPPQPLPPLQALRQLPYPAPTVHNQSFTHDRDVTVAAAAAATAPPPAARPLRACNVQYIPYSPGRQIGSGGAAAEALDGSLMELLESSGILDDIYGTNEQPMGPSTGAVQSRSELTGPVRSLLTPPLPSPQPAPPSNPADAPNAGTVVPQGECGDDMYRSRRSVSGAHPNQQDYPREVPRVSCGGGGDGPFSTAAAAAMLFQAGYGAAFVSGSGSGGSGDGSGGSTGGSGGLDPCVSAHSFCASTRDAANQSATVFRTPGVAATAAAAAATETAVGAFHGGPHSSSGGSQQTSPFATPGAPAFTSPGTDSRPGSAAGGGGGAIYGAAAAAQAAAGGLCGDGCGGANGGRRPDLLAAGYSGGGAPGSCPQTGRQRAVSTHSSSGCIAYPSAQASGGSADPRGGPGLGYLSWGGQGTGCEPSVLGAYLPRPQPQAAAVSQPQLQPQPQLPSPLRLYRAADTPRRHHHHHHHAPDLQFQPPPPPPPSGCCCISPERITQHPQQQAQQQQQQQQQYLPYSPHFQHRQQQLRLPQQLQQQNQRHMPYPLMQNYLTRMPQQQQQQHLHQQQYVVRHDVRRDVRQPWYPPEAYEVRLQQHQLQHQRQLNAAAAARSGGDGMEEDCSQLQPFSPDARPAGHPQQICNQLGGPPAADPRYGPLCRAARVTNHLPSAAAAAAPPAGFLAPPLWQAAWASCRTDDGSQS